MKTSFLFSIILHTLIIVIIVVMSIKAKTGILIKEQRESIEIYTIEEIEVLEHNVNIDNTSIIDSKMINNNIVNINQTIENANTKERYNTDTLTLKSSEDLFLLIHLMIYNSISTQMENHHMDYNGDHSLLAGFCVNLKGYFLNQHLIKKSRNEELNKITLQTIQRLQPIDNIGSYLYEQECFQIDVVFIQ